MGSLARLSWAVPPHSVSGSSTLWRGHQPTHRRGSSQVQAAPWAKRSSAWSKPKGWARPCRSAADSLAPAAVRACSSSATAWAWPSICLRDNASRPATKARKAKSNNSASSAGRRSVMG